MKVDKTSVIKERSCTRSARY